jgi:hypothetical protein
MDSGRLQHREHRTEVGRTVLTIDDELVAFQLGERLYD